MKGLLKSCLSSSTSFLERYAAAGGSFKEVVIEEAGHVPFIEKPEEFNQAFHAHLKGV
jgi:pimeloyl-ACP methyl ester carboxylesterase